MTQGTPGICLGPTRNIRGTYSFLSLTTGLEIKRRHFDELPAPDSNIKQVATLADNNGIFANTHKIPLDWPDIALLPEGLDPTPMAIYPNIHAEMPGVLLSCHIPTETPPPHFIEPDGSQLAD